MTFMRNRKNLIIAKNIFTTVFLAVIALQFSNLYFIEITSRLFSECLLWLTGGGFAVFGGIAYHIERKARLTKYMIVIAAVLLISLLTLFMNKNLLVVVGLGGGVIGYLDIINTIDTGPE